MKKHFLILILLPAVVVSIQAQQPLAQSQYVFNPYLYNPIWAGFEDEANAYFSVRKQWWGVEGSPTLVNATVEMPFTDEVRLGSQLNYQSLGPYTNLILKVSANYQILMYSEQRIIFGLSGGLVHNAFNLSESSDPSDPALSRIAENNQAPIIDFGVGYVNEQIKLSASLPQLLPSQGIPKNETDDEINTSPIDFWIVAASYTYVPEFIYSELSIEPQLLYHGNKYTGGQYEAMCSFNHEKFGLAGISYRQYLGLSVFAGFKASDYIMVNYVYGFNTGTQTNLPSNAATHDIGIRLTFDNPIPQAGSSNSTMYY